MWGFLLWLGWHRRDPQNLLAVLVRAREFEGREASVRAAFRAGLKVGSEHPEVAEWLKATYEKED